MRYEERPPPPDLADVVDSFWSFEVGALPESSPGHVVVPDGAVSLVQVETPGARLLRLVGPRVTAYRPPVAAGGRYLGVRLLPGAAPSLLGVAIGPLRGAVVPLDSVAADLACAVAASVRDGGADRTGGSVASEVAFGPPLRARLRGRPAPDPRLMTAVRRLRASHGGEPVSRLAGRAGVSSRQLLRLFRENVGLSPKELARVLRLRRACLLAVGSPDTSWADLSRLTGYADQAHLVREFGGLLGLPPRRAAALLRRIRHEFLGSSDSFKTVGDAGRTLRGTKGEPA